MSFPPNLLSPRERNALSSTIAFIKDRLARKETVEWAASLTASDTVKRQAVLHWLARDEGINLREPWRTAWRLIEESWRETGPADDSWHKHVIRQRLQAGDRSDTLVTAIVDLFKPRLVVKPFPNRSRQFHNPPKRPRNFHDMFLASLTSGNVVNPGFFGLEEVNESRFLVSLAHGLDAALARGLDIASRIGWGGQAHFLLQRVYYASACESEDDTDEPDAFQRGLAPSIKVLHAVASRLIDLDPQAAVGLVNRWKHGQSPIYLRLWASISRDPRLTPVGEVAEFLLNLDLQAFWNARYFPEIAELRAQRFVDLSDAMQEAVTGKIRKGMARRFWRRDTPAQFIAETRLNWTVRELRRIEEAGGVLPPRHKAWLLTIVQQHPELADVLQTDQQHAVTVRDIYPEPNYSLDSLIGINRLQALERALSSPSRGLDDLPAGAAFAWMNQEDRPSRVLADIESTGNGGTDFPRVWENFGWVHSRPAEQDRKTQEAERVLRLLALLPEGVLRRAVGGIAHWLSFWRHEVVEHPIWSAVWTRVWPLAVEQSNAAHRPENTPELDVRVWFSTDDRQDVDTLNPPAAKLIDVFLAACPNLTQNPSPFNHSDALRAVRNQIIEASGQSALIAKYRLIELVGYFFHADEGWTREQLIRRLRAHDEDSLALWRAVSRGKLLGEVQRIIGDDMTVQVNDHRLSRETRGALAFWLVVESLHALREQRQPAVEYDRVQQMIRSLNDQEVRVSCANAVRQFLVQMSSPTNEEPGAPSPKDLFHSVVRPFMENVWPQERSLTSPGLSHMLARLPALARGGFAEAVGTVERFLTPFPCWTMSDYQFLGTNSGETGLGMIADDATASALLRLLDQTVGRDPDAVVPYDLGEALAQVRNVASHLVQEPSYRRLETAARRARW